VHEAYGTLSYVTCIHVQFKPSGQVQDDHPRRHIRETTAVVDEGPRDAQGYQRFFSLFVNHQLTYTIIVQLLRVIGTKRSST
jgi:hypothetical protein